MPPPAQNRAAAVAPEPRRAPGGLPTQHLSPLQISRSESAFANWQKSIETNCVQQANPVAARLGTVLFDQRGEFQAEVTQQLTEQARYLYHDAVLLLDMAQSGASHAPIMPASSGEGIFFRDLSWTGVFGNNTDPAAVVARDIGRAGINPAPTTGELASASLITYDSC